MQDRINLAIEYGKIDKNTIIIPIYKIGSIKEEGINTAGTMADALLMIQGCSIRSRC
jgi:hypothetical protein